MKLKHIFPLIVAAVITLVGCNEDFEPTLQTDLRPSTSFVSLDPKGGSSSITISSNSDWSFEKINEVTVLVKDANGNVLKNAKGKDSTAIELMEAPEWLKITPLQGTAGETTVTFSAEAANGRTATLRIKSSTTVQDINVVQGTKEVNKVTVAEALNGQEGSIYRVTGNVTNWYNNYELYGNYYIEDKTGKILVYGTADKDGKLKNNPIASWGIDLGDEITVEGSLGSYKGTPQLIDVTVVKLTKSLVKIEAPKEEPVVPVEGGEIEVKVSFKGKGVVPLVDAKYDWVRVSGVDIIAGIPTAVQPNPADTAIVKLTVAPNDGKTRSGVVQLTSSNGKSSSTVEFKFSQKAFVLPHGETADDPFTVAEVLEYTKALGNNVESDNNVYVVGVISSIKYTYSAQDGTATYNISDDGNAENEFVVYGSYFLDNKPWAEGNDQIEVGDKVMVCGKVINYGGTTPEFVNKKNYLVSLKKAAAPEPGTLECPFTVAQALEAAGKLNGDEKEVSADDYYIKGKISQIKYTFSAQYGTAQFHISEDGTTEGGQFLIYGVYYLGNKPWAEGNTQIAVGDEVIICGKITNYGGTLETANKKSYIYSLNGATE